MMWIFNNADSAFDYYKSQILNNGIDFDNTKALFNVGFTIENPLDRDWETKAESALLNIHIIIY